jgi:hypothetical protein
VIRGRLRRRKPSTGGEEGAPDECIEVDPGELTGILTVPAWVRNLGLLSWFLVGIGVMPLIAWMKGLHPPPRCLGGGRFAALGIHPLAVLIVTIAGGALFGAIGLILAAPLTSAITRISADLANARAAEAPASVAPEPALEAT